MTTDQVQQAILILTQWGNGDYSSLPYHGAGICLNLKTALRIPGHKAIIPYLRPFFRNWPHFSGDNSYPIKDPINYCSAYSIYHSYEDLWPKNAYGDLRRDLCLHLADGFAEQLQRISDRTGESEKHDSAN